MIRDKPKKAAPGHTPHWAKSYRTFFASSSGAVVATFFTFPLESIKTRIQSYPNGFFDCVRSVWKEEGFRGFWRGVAAPTFTVTVVRTLSFGIYQRAKYVSSDFLGRVTGEDEPLVVVNKPGSMPTLQTVACFGFAGGTSGAISTLVACPFELTKNAMVIAKQIAESKSHHKLDAVSTSYRDKNTYRTARQIVRNLGPRGLYSGFQLQMTRETLGTGLYFMTYESAKQLIVKYQGHNSPASPSAVAIAGAFCGAVGLFSTYPIDRAKTAYQRACLEQGRSRPAAVPGVEYFRRASYQGLSVAMVRSAMTNAILFSCFEYTKKRINGLPDPLIDAETEKQARW